jgi:hypothetical protein
MKKVYVVQRVGFQYAYRSYYRVGGGYPVKIYVNRARAEHEADTLAVETIKEGRALLYTAYDDVYKNLQELNERLETIYGRNYPQIDNRAVWDWTVPKDSTQEQLLAVAKTLREVTDIVFFEVVETEIEE